jgi:hypothetical protein
MLVDSCPLRLTAASLETFDAVVAMNAPLGVAVESSLLVGQFWHHGWLLPEWCAAFLASALGALVRHYQLSFE